MVKYNNIRYATNLVTIHNAMINDLINKFMREPDVINGSAFMMGKNQPKSWYEAISTCGYCVKVSKVFIERHLQSHPIFSGAKTISIAIDSNKFGKCGDGSPNSWHTAIDTGFGLMVDLTIAQFGSKYNNRFIWKKVDWLNEFQDINDNHDIGDMNYDEALKLSNIHNNPKL